MYQRHHACKIIKLSSKFAKHLHWSVTKFYRMWNSICSVAHIFYVGYRTNQFVSKDHDVFCPSLPHDLPQTFPIALIAWIYKYSKTNHILFIYSFGLIVEAINCTADRLSACYIDQMLGSYNSYALLICFFLYLFQIQNIFSTKSSVPLLLRVTKLLFVYYLAY